MITESTICLEKFGNPEKKQCLPIKSVYPIPRTREAWEEKNFVYFDLGNNLELSVLTRKVEYFCLPTLLGFGMDTPTSSSDIYLFAWDILRQRGFSVVPSASRVDAITVATINLTEDTFTSVYDQKIDAAQVRDTFPMDREFVKIPIEAIKKEAQALLKLANRMGVELMSDGPFHIVVQRDASWYLSFLDIGKVRIHANPKNLPRSAEKDNAFYINKAVMAFSSIQQNINALRTARKLS